MRSRFVCALMLFGIPLAAIIAFGLFLLFHPGNASRSDGDWIDLVELRDGSLPPSMIRLHPSGDWWSRCLRDRALASVHRNQINSDVQAGVMQPSDCLIQDTRRLDQVIFSFGSFSQCR